MRRMLIAAAMIGSSAVLPISAQQALPPLRIGGHVAGNMMNGPFDLYRVGGQLVIPVGTRLALYPAVSRFVQGAAKWELSAALRYRPFGAREGSSPLYLGVGAAGVNWGTYGTTYDLLITGLETPRGRLRPYVELQFLGLMFRLVDPSQDFGVQAYAGLTWAVR